MDSLLAALVDHAALAQSILFGAVIVCCWSCENANLLVSSRRKRHRARVNAMFALCALPIQVGMTGLCVALAQWVTQHHWGLLYCLPGQESPWVRLGLMFVVLDLLDYVYHVAMHHVPLFWRFHLVHHTDRDIDASTTVREHPGETVVRNSFLILWVFLSGASLELLVLRQTVETVANILAHTSFRLNGGIARMAAAVFITPNLHHVHHHHVRPYTNRNYGDVFSVWDRLFGTLATLERCHTVVGLDAHPGLDDMRFAEVFEMPFVRTGGTTGTRVLAPAST